MADNKNNSERNVPPFTISRVYWGMAVQGY